MKWVRLSLATCIRPRDAGEAGTANELQRHDGGRRRGSVEVEEVADVVGVVVEGPVGVESAAGAEGAELEDGLGAAQAPAGAAAQAGWSGSSGLRVVDGGSLYRRISLVTSALESSVLPGDRRCSNHPRCRLSELSAHVLREKSLIRGLGRWRFLRCPCFHHQSRRCPARRWNRLSSARSR